MGRSSSSKVKSHSASQEIPHLLWKPKVRYRVHNSLPLAPLLSQIHPQGKILFEFVHFSYLWWD